MRVVGTLKLALATLMLLPLATAGRATATQTSLDTCAAAPVATGVPTLIAEDDSTLPGLALRPEEPVEATSCMVDCDCPYGEVCEDGTCVLDFGPYPHCRCDAECSTGEVCVDGRCESEGASCTVDCDCPYGEVCENGTCVLDFGPYPHCRCDAECSSGETCVNGACQNLSL